MNTIKSSKLQLNKMATYSRLLLCLVVLSFLAACANNSDGSSVGTGVDLATASDETDAQKRAKIRLELAMGYLEQGQINVALDEVKLAIAADPRSSDAYSQRGLIYMRLNDFGLARDSFNRGIQLNSRDGNLFHNLAWLACQENRYAEAALNFDKALSIAGYSGHAKTFVAKGVCFQRAGDLRQAESNFLRSFELDASNPVAIFNLANLLYKRNEFTRAQFYIRRLNNNEYANSESIWLATKIEKKLGNSQSVIQLTDRLRKQFPTSREYGLYERGTYDE